MQNLNTVDQILNANSGRFDAQFRQGDALVIPTGYSKPVFKVTESEIFLLRADGSVWDEYDMPETDVVAYIEDLLSSIGL